MIVIDCRAIIGHWNEWHLINAGRREHSRVFRTPLKLRSPKFRMQRSQPANNFVSATVDYDRYIARRRNENWPIVGETLETEIFPEIINSSRRRIVPTTRETGKLPCVRRLFSFLSSEFSVARTRKVPLFVLETHRHPPRGLKQLSARGEGTLRFNWFRLISEFPSYLSKTRAEPQDR